MPDTRWLIDQAHLSLRRLAPRLNERYAAHAGAEGWQTFSARLKAHFPRLFGLLFEVYGQRYDFFYHLEQIVNTAAEAWLSRPAELRALDETREADPGWYQSNQMLAGVCYVDLFAGNLPGIRDRIPYFKELGLTYLHLMPLFQCPAGNNDGGYAVSSYRQINPALGTMGDLCDLARELRENGISLVLDFIFNHTSDEHEWAVKARAGDPDYRDFYFLFPDRQMPDAYERHLREIFPDEHPGAFTYLPDIERWVWTTFHSFQWDLNYANPAVFAAMGKELLYLANAGVEVLRLDAVAFIWKRLGTACENLPEAHLIIQAFNTLVRIAAPALLFKSEAIVHPDEVAKYIRPDECQLSYNPLLMALLWNSLATREVRLLRLSMAERLRIDPGTAWVNYVRCHDDIGWTFSNEDAARLGIRGHDHRQFLNAFYIGQFPGSFARGLPFQGNPRTGDMRISGTLASLAGLEKALRGEVDDEVELAIRRILLLHSIILSLGGIPLIYFGDEIGILNDYEFRRDPVKADDSRWVHRPRMDWQRAAQRTGASTIAGRIFQPLQRLIALRQRVPAFSGPEAEIVETGNDHIFGYVRECGGTRVLVLANFSESEQTICANLLRTKGLSETFLNLVTHDDVTALKDLVLGPYQFAWLQS
jgi:glycosidase